MTRLDALRALEAAVEARTERPEDIAKAFGVTPWNKWPYHKATTSIDAWLALLGTTLPGYRVKMQRGGHDSFGEHIPDDIWLVVLFSTDVTKRSSFIGPAAKGHDPARTGLLAIIRALIAEAGE